MGLVAEAAFGVTLAVEALVVLEDDLSDAFHLRDLLEDGGAEEVLASHQAELVNTAKLMIDRITAPELVQLMPTEIR